MRKFFTLLFLLSSLSGFSRTLKIGILTQFKVDDYQFFAEVGNYALTAGDAFIMSVNEGDRVVMKYRDGKVAVYFNDEPKGSYSSVKFEKRDQMNIFKLRPLIGDADTYTYDDELLMNTASGYLRPVNVINADKYVAGVVEAEIGKENHPELLKCKSVICRTYALGHIGRHRNEGYDLCDKTHCQVYKGKNRFNFDIFGAVEATHGQIIVDNNSKPIDAVFHSNCGGVTVNAEDVWNHPLPYLKSIVDTFCLRGKHATWEKTISIDQWTGYLFARSSLPRDYVCVDSNFARRQYISCGEKYVPLKTVRNELGLYSTYFRVDNMGDYILLRGKGFGHGVGLCQEGAIHMADLGYAYPEIIKFYYRGVQIISLN